MLIIYKYIYIYVCMYVYIYIHFFSLCLDRTEYILSIICFFVSTTCLIKERLQSAAIKHYNLYLGIVYVTLDNKTIHFINIYIFFAPSDSRFANSCISAN